MIAIEEKIIHLPNGPIDVNGWLTRFQANAISSTDIIQKAVQLAEVTAQGLTTFYGKPYLAEGIKIAEILVDLKLDHEAIAASIITPIHENYLTLDTIKKQLGENIEKLVRGVRQTKIIDTLQTHTNKTRDKTKIDCLRKLFLAMVSDIRVVLIKLAERLCIMYGIKNINPTERQRFAQETLDIYAPLANRLGVGQLKGELEDIAFRYLDPAAYKKIAAFLAERRSDREKRIQEMLLFLNKNFEEEKMKAVISGRAKHIYSIYTKSQKKHLNYQDIYDYSALRILVPTVNDCYAALSIVNKLWESIPDEFCDYIANPKPNGYRSIHTAVIDQYNKYVEIQIRTHKMHEEAEHGIAAHWLYKEDKTRDPDYQKKITFLRQLLAWHKDLVNQGIQPDSTMKTIFEDCIYVYTPMGDVIELPKDATPLDFAYHIHTALGHRCRGAKINGHIVPLTHALHTGDRVEILTTPQGIPSRDWLRKEAGYIKTANAYGRVAHWFKQQDSSQRVEADKKISHPPKRNLPPAIVPTDTPSAVSLTGVRIDGVGGGLLVRIAGCCQPIPPNAVIGYITQSRGVSIHRKNCSTVSYLTQDYQDRLVQVEWNSLPAK
ncbi:MAG: relA [Gammaproteobacteria bacterium]|jgi:GTP pyrophosphokinase|nr:relA [Gammaproteobacteria bacterium]